MDSTTTEFSLEEALWFGDFDDSAAEHDARESLAAAVGLARGLKPLPEAASRLLMLCRDDDPDEHEIVRVIEGDPAVATRVLHVVNSAAYALGTPCRTVAHALRMLGSRFVAELATGLMIQDMYGSRDALARALRDHGAVVGALARQVAEWLDRSPPENAFMAGLLHDLGKMLLLQVEERDYRRLLGDHGDRDEAHVPERRTFGFDHGLLGGHLLRAWNLPEPIPTVVAWHHQPARAFAEGRELGELMSILRFADLLAHELAARDAGDDKEPAEDLAARLMDDESALYLGLSAKRIVEELPELDETYREALALWS
jgi:putative nucleotidyltransferase with HDIG domain